MPARNAASFIHEAVDSLIRVNNHQWELIVINDNSTNNTYDVVKRYEGKDSRIRVYNNSGNGKVKALNYGYTLIKGNIIKCIDSDDVLLPRFFEVTDMKDHDALCHDAFVVNEDLQMIGVYFINPAYLKNDYDTVVSNLISLPRWTWSFNRDLADKIFPLPTDLPFEDVWFALVIKRFAHNIRYVNQKLYLYRQHKNQTFGGILNYKKEIINFRARRIIRLVRALSSNAERIQISDVSRLGYMERYNLLLVDRFQFFKILKSEIMLIHKLKIILMCFFPTIASSITKLKWRLDQILNQ